MSMRCYLGDSAQASVVIAQSMNEAGAATDLDVLLTLDDALRSCNPILSSFFFGSSNSVKIQLTIGQLDTVTFNWNIPSSFLSETPGLTYDTQSTAYGQEQTCGVSSGRVLGTPSI